MDVIRRMDIATGTATCLPRGVYAGFAKYRHKVFVEKLGWELDCDDGVELDQFDRADTLYVIARSPAGTVIGGARLLPTTGRYLLADVFPQLLGGQDAPCSPDIWELSRFAAADLDRVGPGNTQFSSPIAVGLLRAAIEAAASRGARRLITVSPLGVERLLRKAGFSAHRAGPPVVVDGHPLFACWIDLAATA